MNRFRAWLASRIAPDFEICLEETQRLTQQRLLDLDRHNSLLREENHALLARNREDESKALLAERQSEMAEAISMYGSGPWQRTGLTVSESGSIEGPAGSPLVKFKERYWELELALEDRGWQRQLAQSQTEFSRYGIQQIMLICRLYFIKNPLVRRGVELCADYVFGRGFEITSDDEDTNTVIECMLKANAKQLSTSALLQKERTLRTDGNIFWVLFTDPLTGQVMVQTIDAAEIEDIVCNPDNSDEEWFFKRRYLQNNFSPKEATFQQDQKVCWYVALGYDTDEKSFGPGDEPVIRQENGEPVYVYHRKVGGIEKWKFGCPEVYPMIDWVRAYKHYLEDWCTLQRAFARFSWDVETKGGQGAIANFKQALATTLANGGTWWENNPPPTVASAFISGPGTKMTPIRTPQNNPEAGRRIAMMACSAIGLPETMLLGDATTGSLATAVSLDRPTELKFTQRQFMWADDLEQIVGFALEKSATSAKGRLREAGSEDRPIRMERGKDGAFKAAFTEADRAKKPAAKKDASDGAIAVRVTFPAVLEHDITARVAAIAEAMTLNGFECTGIDLRVGVKLLLEELGVEDSQTVIEAMFPEDEYAEIVDRTPELKMEQKQALNPPAPGMMGPGGMPPLAPAPRKPHAQKISAQPPSPSKASEAVERAVLALERTLEARRLNGHA